MGGWQAWSITLQFNSCIINVEKNVADILYKGKNCTYNRAANLFLNALGKASWNEEISTSQILVASSVSSNHQILCFLFVSMLYLKSSSYYVPSCNDSNLCKRNKSLIKDHYQNWKHGAKIENQKKRIASLTSLPSASTTGSRRYFVSSSNLTFLM